MGKILESLLSSYSKCRKRTYKVIIQEDSQLQAWTHKWNATLSNVPSFDYEAFYRRLQSDKVRALPPPKGAIIPGVMYKQGMRYVLYSDSSSSPGALKPKYMNEAEVQDLFRYLEHLIANKNKTAESQPKSGEESNAAQQRALAMEPMLQQAGGVVQQWMPYEVPDDQALRIEYRHGPGFLKKLKTLITESPDFNPRSKISKFKEAIRQTSPILSPDIQKELVDLHERLADLALKVVNGKIRKEDLPSDWEDMRKIISISRPKNQKKKNIWVNPKNSQLTMPMLSLYFDNLGDYDSGMDYPNSLTLGDPLEDYANRLSDVDIMDGDSNVGKLFKTYNGFGATGPAELTLGKLKEQFFLTFLSMDKPKPKDMKELLEPLKEWIDSIVQFDLSQLNELPLGGGFLSNEDVSEIMNTLKDKYPQIDPEKLPSHYIANTITEGMLMKSLIQNSGATLSDILDKSQISTPQYKGDLELEFATPVDYFKFTDYLQKEVGVNYNVGEQFRTLPISLKAYLTDNNIKVGNTSIGSLAKWFSRPSKAHPYYGKYGDNYFSQYENFLTGSYGVHIAKRKINRLNKIGRYIGGYFSLLDSVGRDIKDAYPTFKNKSEHLFVNANTRIRADYDYLLRKLKDSEAGKDIKVMQATKAKLFGLLLTQLSETKNGKYNKDLKELMLLTTLTSEDDTLIMNSSYGKLNFASNWDLSRRLLDECDMTYDIGHESYTTFKFKLKGSDTLLYNQSIRPNKNAANSIQMESTLKPNAGLFNQYTHRSLQQDLERTKEQKKY
jgi:hypothetical protein